MTTMIARVVALEAKLDGLNTTFNDSALHVMDLALRALEAKVTDQNDRIKNQTDAIENQADVINLLQERTKLGTEGFAEFQAIFENTRINTMVLFV